MSIEKAKNYLAEFGRADDIMEFDVSSATVELTPSELEGIVPECTWVDVCKLPEC